MRSRLLTLLVIATLGLAPARSAPAVSLKLIGTMNVPIAMALRAGDPAVYVATQPGQVRTIVGGVIQPGNVLDISSLISYGGERGLLGIAFNPAGDKFYADYTAGNGDIHVDEWAVTGGVIQSATRRQVISIEHRTYSNHNGGNIVFGPDGYLYIGTGDGGGGGDPNGNGQNLGVLLGKLLRIDPNGDPYTIPSDNPFVHTPGAKPEIWAYGLRNPWRWEFDKTRGDLWIGDVGQNAWEEVDAAAAGNKGGQNYGWNCYEGTHPYNQQCRPANAVMPLYEYSHGGGNCAIIGGFVYRGSAIPGLRGAYLYADLCVGHVIELTQTDKVIPSPVDLGVGVPSPTSFGQDAAGELYLLSGYGGVYQLVPA